MIQINKPSAQLKFIGFKYSWDKVFEIYEIIGLCKQIYKMGDNYYE